MILSLLMQKSTATRRSMTARKHKTTDYSTLEPRNLLATITVDTALDNGNLSDGLISLREAIIASNTNFRFGDAPGGTAGTDEIIFDASLDGQTISLNGTSIPITEAIEIRGFDVEIGIDGGNQSRHFDINTVDEVIFSDIDFINGNAEDGGAVLMEGGGTLRLTSTSFNSNGEIFETSKGGAVYARDSSVFVLDSAFSGNIASSGGAIYSENGTMNIIDSTFDGNFANSQGGAVALVDGTYFVSQSDFTDNSATDFLIASGGGGGAIFAGGSSTTTRIYDSTFTNNDSGFGGGVFNGRDNLLVVRNNSTFTDNAAIGFQSPNGTSSPNGEGGGIYNVGTANIVDVEFISNTAAFGGGFFSTIGNSTLNRVTLSENFAANSGGGIAMEGGTILAIDTVVGGDEASEGNTANFQDGLQGDAGAGGGIAVLDSADPDKPSILRFVGGEISYNSARFLGGGILNSAGSFLRIFNNTVIHNNSTIVTQRDFVPPRGGGIYNSGVVNLNDVTIVENSTIGSGGGIFMDGGFLSAGNTVISANQAFGAGGGINMEGGRAKLFQTIIGGLSREEGNVAGTFGPGGFAGIGGGVHISGDDGVRFRMIGGAVSHNTATLAGGGIDQRSESTVLLENYVNVESNRALREDGGGIFNDGGHLELRDSVFAGNASRNGGGIFNESGTAVLTGSEVRFNEARLTGGGIFNRGSFFRNSTFINSNTAPANPDIFNEPAV